MNELLTYSHLSNNFFLGKTSVETAIIRKITIPVYLISGVLCVEIVRSSFNFFDLTKRSFRHLKLLNIIIVRSEVVALTAIFLYGISISIVWGSTYLKLINKLDEWQNRNPIGDIKKVCEQTLECYKGERSTLDLSDSGLEDLPDIFPFLPGIQTLILTRNHFKNLPIEMWVSLKGLSCIDLSENKLEFLSYKIGQIVNLRIIVLDENLDLKFIPLSLARYNRIVMIRKCCSINPGTNEPIDNQFCVDNLIRALSQIQPTNEGSNKTPQKFAAYCRLWLGLYMYHVEIFTNQVHVNLESRLRDKLKLLSINFTDEQKKVLITWFKQLDQCEDLEMDLVRNLTYVYDVIERLSNPEEIEFRNSFFSEKSGDHELLKDLSGLSFNDFARLRSQVKSAGKR